MIARILPRTGPRRRRLLYIEDDAVSVARVQRLLADRKDLLLLHAADLDLGIKLARGSRPEVILVDIDLAGPSALGATGLLALLHGEPGAPSAPVLALSANAAASAVVKGLEAGFFHYLTRPLKAGPFIEALEYALEFAALERDEQL